MTKEQAISFIKRTARKYKVKVTFIDDRELGGKWRPYNITISTWHEPNFIIEAFFHELGHQYCYNKGLFKIYHNIYGDINNNQQLLAIMSTALRAERFVDNWGSKEVLKFFPCFKFRKVYYTDYGVSFLKKNMKTIYSFYFKVL